jgi:hypothetical protein
MWMLPVICQTTLPFCNGAAMISLDFAGTASVPAPDAGLSPRPKPYAAGRGPWAQPLDPAGKAGLGQRRVDRRNDLAERVMARDAARERQKAPQKRQVLAAPQGRLGETIAPAVPHSSRSSSSGKGCNTLSAC